MANATSIVVNDLNANGSIASPTAQVLDTGTAAVTLETGDLAGGMKDLVIDVTNLAAAALTVTIEAGEDPAWYAFHGPYTSPSIAQNGRRLFGPFSSDRFTRRGSKLRVTFTPASGTITGNFTAYRLPKV